MASPAVALTVASCAGLAPVRPHKCAPFLNRFIIKCSFITTTASISTSYSSKDKGSMPLPLRAVALDSTNSLLQLEKSQKYFFVIANAKFMLDEEEHFNELLSERLRNYGEGNKDQDFWLVIEPKFLDKFPNITKRLKRPAVALVSTNGPWITDGRLTKPRLDIVCVQEVEDMFQ